eukprot:TRINITY_DN5483_c0_g1_i2.p1 TRINITY_DN5483_c0_g1~~TRINITY_DN5483_c0_g1_i2.p1  ORF type:complete len:381 (+),score=128.45 TRINITY_DN5483_c0_g1_i2:439-1581(+)
MAEHSEKLSEVGERLSQAVKELVERCNGLKDTAEKYSGRLKTEGDALGEQATRLEKDIKQQLKELNASAEKEEISSNLFSELEEELYRARGMVYEGDVAALLPHKANGWYLGLFLGPVNVRSVRKDIRFKVKEEYNSYRDRTALLFLIFPSLMLLVKDKLCKGCLPGVLVHLYQAWLLLFYTSLAFRENILRINGSDIRPWWIQHHYAAMTMALVSLTWNVEGENCVELQEGVGLFFKWAMMQGIAMLLQNRYQRRRLYTRIALGKAGRMDVVWGETAGVKGQLLLLYPLLFVLQGFQLYIGVQLLIFAVYRNFRWQIFACGALLILMAIGNFVNTVATLWAKFHMKAKMKKQGKQMLQRMYSKSSSTAGAGGCSSSKTC